MLSNWQYSKSVSAVLVDDGGVFRVSVPPWVNGRSSSMPEGLNPCRSFGACGAPTSRAVMNSESTS